jgi:hypothetical protein
MTERRFGAFWSPYSARERPTRCLETSAVTRHSHTGTAKARTSSSRKTGGRILGTYFLRANQPGRGSHVSNCCCPQIFATVVRTASRRPWLETVLVMKTTENQSGHDARHSAHVERSKVKLGSASASFAKNWAARISCGAQGSSSVTRPIAAAYIGRCYPFPRIAGATCRCSATRRHPSGTLSTRNKTSRT